MRAHPQGDRILYLDSHSGARHSLFAYDLKTKSTRKFFRTTRLRSSTGRPTASTSPACWAPRAPDAPPTDGLWIGQPDSDHATWWHVPGSTKLAQAELGSLLEQLPASRPAWTADGRSFAFVTYRQAASQATPANRDSGSARCPGTASSESPGNRHGSTICTGHLAATVLGLVRGGIASIPFAFATPASSRKPAGHSSHLEPHRRPFGRADPRPVTVCWVVRAGDQLAYVVPGGCRGAKDPLWSFVLVPNSWRS